MHHGKVGGGMNNDQNLRSDHFLKAHFQENIEFLHCSVLIESISHDALLSSPMCTMMIEKAISGTMSLMVAQ